MNLAHDIHAAEGGLRDLLWQAHLNGQAAHWARQVQAADNALDSVDRLGQALLASRGREAALQREVAALRAQLQAERARPRALDWGHGLARRA
ncbi:hypothetical protein PKCBPO_00869 [Methylorubrum thiocyanatum]